MENVPQEKRGPMRVDQKAPLELVDFCCWLMCFL